MTFQTGLAGLKLFVVEDEPLVLMFIEDTLSEIGCEIVATATSLAEATSKLAALECDVVMLDVNLKGEQTFELALSLSERNFQLIFSTGYGVGAIPPELLHVPVLQKPFQEFELRNVLSRIVTGRT